MMKSEKFSDALGCASEKYIDEAETYTAKPKNKAWIKWASTAACIAVAFGLAFGGIFSSRKNEIPSFIITAQAADGSTTDLRLEESMFNSGVTKGYFFDVDMPTFDFFVRPENSRASKALYDQFDISVSYNGHRVSGRDEHIVLGYRVPQKNSVVSWSYMIFGWFDEPTDVHIVITDKESRETVETLTVRVTYVAERQEYELKMTEKK